MKIKLMLNFIKIMHLLGQGNGYILMQNNQVIMIRPEWWGMNNYQTIRFLYLVCLYYGVMKIF